jgi:ketosteroid isomerase-like protein
MSQENVEIVRRAHQAFNDRNLDALLASFTDDAEWRLIGGFADLIGTEFRGHEGLRRLFNEWVDNLGLQSEMEAVLDADDRVAVTLRVTGAGGASGVPTTIRSGNVYFFRDGKISAVDSYYEASEALKAVGVGGNESGADAGRIAVPSRVHRTPFQPLSHRRRRHRLPSAEAWSEIGASALVRFLIRWHSAGGPSPAPRARSRRCARHRGGRH